MKFSVFLFLILSLNLTTGGNQDSYSEMRKKMVVEQIQKRGITDERIGKAFLKMKRHLFVEPAYREIAYNDTDIPIGEGQTTSHPYIIAIMTFVIAPDYNKKVLEIGTGSGYQTAILAELVKEVYTIEIKAKLAKRSNKLLTKLGYQNIKFKIGDGYLGWEKHAPFDGIIVTCAPDHIPPPLIKQLAKGGRMVIPILYSSTVQDLILLEKDQSGRIKKTNLIPVQFVPLIRGNNAGNHSERP